MNKVEMMPIFKENIFKGVREEWFFAGEHSYIRGRDSTRHKNILVLKINIPTKIILG